MATQLSLSNVVTVSVTESAIGVNQFNTGNIGLFTTETPDPVFTSGYKIYKQPAEVGVDFGTDSTTYAMALAMFSQQPNFTFPGGSLIVMPFEVSETLAAAITRTLSLVSYFGVLTTQIETQVDMLAAAAVIQANQLIAAFPQIADASVDEGGSLDLLRTGGFTQSRGLFYPGASADALLFSAGYLARGLCVNFSGSGTTLNMNLKTINGVQPASVTQTLLNSAEAAGADVYANIGGIAKVLSSGANRFFDQVQNLIALASSLQIGMFNYLASTATKIPQTEFGMRGLVSVCNGVCAQFVQNGYLAPGTWNDPTLFGNPAALISSVANQGFYIYSSPIALQSESDRMDRKAPLIQIAAKEAGAINSAAIMVIVNP